MGPIAELIKIEVNDEILNNDKFTSKTFDSKIKIKNSSQNKDICLSLPKSENANKIHASFEQINIFDGDYPNDPVKTPNRIALVSCQWDNPTEKMDYEFKIEIN